MPNQAYRIIAGQKVFLEPNGYCQCINADYFFIICRHCGLGNIKLKNTRYLKI